MLVLYQVIGTMSGVQVALNVPIGVQEIVLAAWLISKGFNDAALPGPRRPSKAHP